jgi:PPOX class probable F420-dependent enzyme
VSLSVDEARTRFGAARVARLATVTAAGAPHLVPITFALLDESTIVTAVDAKPKRTAALRRLDNIAANPAVSVLADHYSDDWSELWWVRADGTARVVGAGESRAGRRASAIDALAARYAAYRDQSPDGALIVITVARWSGWSFRTT